MPQIESIIEFGHRKVAEVLSPGAWAVDATAGNGHDTSFLADAVGDDGRVWAFDVQAEAIRSTRRRLGARGLAGRVTLLHAGHETMRNALPSEADGRLQAVTFNLGYLPGGDKTRTTASETSLAALRAAASLLAAAGVLAVVCYTGHPGGAEETEAVRQWAEALPQDRFRVLSYCFLNQQNDPPQLVVVEKTAAG